MLQPQSSKAESKTPIEKFVGLLPLPYWASCIVLSILIGPPMQFLSGFIDTGSLQKAFSFTFNLAAAGSGIVTLSSFQGVVAQSAWSLTLFSNLYLQRFMRTKLVSYESNLIPISPTGEATMNRHFGGVYRILPVIIMGVLITLLSGPYIFVQASQLQGSATFVYQAVSNPLVSVLFGGFIWVYFRALWGLYKLGKEPLKLAPSDEDRMLGVKPIGSISFSLFLAYNVVIGLSVLGLFESPDPVSIGALLGLAFLGGVMFFLPLNGIHKRMSENKETEEKQLQLRLTKLSNGVEGETGQVEILKSLRDVQLLKIKRENVSRLPTWPFDTGVLGKFLAIILAVVATLVARLIADLSGIR